MNRTEDEIEQVAEREADDGAGRPNWIADSFTLTEAAKATGASRQKIRRSLDAGGFPNAFRIESGGQSIWRIPINDLLNAGFSVSVDNLPGHRRDNLPEVIDLRDRSDDHDGVRPPQMNSQAVAAVDGFRRTLHDLATESAEAKAGKAAAEAKLEVREEQLADTRAERDRYARMLDERESRRLFRRRRKPVRDQPTTATGPVDASPDSSD